MTPDAGDDEIYEDDGGAQLAEWAVPQDREPPADKALSSAPKPVTLSTEFAGRRGRLFWLALKTSLLTVLTLGFYRFWMKTRLRRYYWSSIRPGGIPLEYVGEPLEKLLGFLIAVVFLAFYIGIANLILMFLSFSLLGGSYAAYAVSFVGVIPLIFYAKYRARRYVLARTRWRGIRFAMDNGAWGYSIRAMLHWLLTILTLGILWPRMTYKLEKYRTDRTFFGNVRLHQGGRWTMLYPPFIPLLIGVLLGAASAALAAANYPQALWGLALALPLMLYGWVNYRVQGFKRLTETKSADGIGFVAAPRRWRVLRIYVLGSVLIVLALSLLLMLFGFSIASIANAFGNPDALNDIMQAIKRLPTWISAAAGAGLYFSFFILWGVLTQVFLTLPLIRHYGETLQITGATHLNSLRQRDRDEFTEAEGFAEALDVGAAI